MRRISDSPARLQIRRLERFAEELGAPVVRDALTSGVLGRMEERRIVLRPGLSLNQQLTTLVHELTHRLVHVAVSPRINRTVCEYEAEAVESWVCAALKRGSLLSVDELTDDLLSSSVARVRFAAGAILHVARGAATQCAPSALKAQTAVDLDTAAGEEVAFHDELDGVGNLVRVT